MAVSNNQLHLPTSSMLPFSQTPLSTHRLTGDPAISSHQTTLTKRLAHLCAVAEGTIETLAAQLAHTLPEGHKAHVLVPTLLPPAYFIREDGSPEALQTKIVLLRAWVDQVPPEGKEAL